MFVYRQLIVVFLLLCIAKPLLATELRFNTQEFAPFNYTIDGLVSGPAVDTINRICQEMRIACKFSVLPWRRAQAEVKQGLAHALFVIGWNEKRATWLHFSPPLLKTEYGFFVQKNNHLEFENANDISGYVVAVYGPSNTSHSLSEVKKKRDGTGFETISIDMQPDDESGFRKLALGRVGAVYSNRDVGFALIKKIGLKNIRYAGDHKKLQYYIGFSKEHTDRKLVEKFNFTFRELHKLGDIQRIIRSYQLEVVENLEKHSTIYPQ